MKHQPYLLIFYTILTIGGLLSGIMAWLFLPDMLAGELRGYVSGQIQLIAESFSWKEVFLPIFNANAMDMLRIYLCGICLLGIPILILFLFLKCFSIGFTACILAQSSVLLLCSRLLFVPILTIAAIIGYKFSLSLVQNTVQSPIRQLIRYSLLFVGVLLCVLLISSIDGLVNYYYLRGM